MSDRDHSPTDLPEDVERLTAALREDVVVRPAWRAALLREIDAAPPPHREVARPRPWYRRRIAVSPALLAAASLAGVAIGATGAAVLMGGLERNRTAGTPVASSAGPRVADTPFRTVADARPLGASAGGTAVRFVIVAPNAARVSVVGNFNGWNPSAAPMARVDGGDAWVRDVVLESGRHVYAFVVDGAIHVDPSAPRAAEDDFGIPSSAIVVPTVAQ